MRDKSGAYSVLVGKPERKGRLGRPRSRWEDNIKMYLQKTGCYGVHCSDLAHGKQGAGACEHSHRALTSVKCEEFLDQPWNCQLLRKDSALWRSISYLASYYHVVKLHIHVGARWFANKESTDTLTQKSNTNVLLLFSYPDWDFSVLFPQL
jgi:hypothetical protein